jgi:hypothetical protein
MYHNVIRIFWNRESDTELEMKHWRISWTPSLLLGRLLVLIEGLKEN